MLVAAGLVAAGVLRAGGHQVLLLAIGVAAIAVLLAGLLLRWSAALAVGIGLLGVQQAMRLELGPDTLDAWTPLVAGGLLLVAELAWWSVEPRVPAWAQPGVAASRLATVLFACVAATVVAAVVVVAAGARVSGGVGLELAGVVAAIGTLAVVVWVARRAVG
ncbi:MAG: hypothetical protein QOG06_876 [Gaiellaceae bacterium]|nr:hypothetical protein [Gaiellaceae bacterium]